MPAVEAPISVFFGMAYDENWMDRDGRYPCYQSAALSVVLGRVNNSFFVMPVRRHCLVTMENRGKQEGTLYYMIEGSWGRVIASGFFGLSKWRDGLPQSGGTGIRVVFSCCVSADASDDTRESIHRARYMRCGKVFCRHHAGGRNQRE